MLHNANDTYCDGGPSWQPVVSVAHCDDPSNTTPEGCTAGEVGDWFDANYASEVLETRCTPWSGSYSECDPDPAPNDCQDPRNAKSSCIGDPVDVTTGHLEQSATDLDLGRGLAFARFYSNGSNAPAPGALGPKWRHGLDWRLFHQNLGGSGDATHPLVESVAVKRPFATPVSFIRETWAAPVGAEPWQGSARGAGGLVGDPSSGGFVFTDDDGTRVTFAATPFEVTKIQRPGAPEIMVSASGNVTTYSMGGLTLSLTLAAGKLSTVQGGGQTWSYTYTPAGCLETVTGPNPGSPSESVAWTYGYASGTCQLASVQRTIGSGTPVQLAAWTYSGERVTSVDEPALDQTLHLTYSGSSPLTTAVRDQAGTSAPTLATFTSEDGRVVETTGVGGPGVAVPIRDASFTAATSEGAPGNLWKTTTDLNDNVTLYEAHDASGRPGIVTEGWDDADDDGEFDTGEDYARRREYTYHPTLDVPTVVREKSAITGGGLDRLTSDDYHASPAACSAAPASHSLPPTDRLRRRCLRGFTIDAAGATTAFTDTTDYTYDSQGRVTEIAGPRAAQLTTIAYDAASGSRSAVRRYLNGTGSSYLEWTFSDFDAQGNPRTVTDPNGRATLFTYDALGRVLTVKPPYPGVADSTVVFTYDVDGNLTKVTFPNDSAGGPVWLELGYDTQKPDQLRSLRDSKSNAIVYTYSKGFAVREERYAGFTSLTSPGTRVGDARFSPTAAGRLFRAFNPLVPGCSDSLASCTVFSEFGHDPKGNPTSLVDENGKQDVLGYDALDRLKEIEQTRALTYETRFEYDALSNVTRVTDAASKATDLLHDDRGHLVESVSPDTGRTRFVYDAAGNLVTKIENAPATGSGGRVTHYSYDGLDRLTGIDLSSDPDWTFTYDGGASLNRKGRLASASNGAVTTELTYTQRGEVYFERTTVAGRSYTVYYAYDAAGNRTSILTPDATQIDTAYAGLRPASIDAGGTSQQVRAIEWHPFGPWTAAELPKYDAVAGHNTVVSHRDVNLRGQISRIQVTNAGASVLDRSYTYNLDGDGVTVPDDPGPNLDEVVDAVVPSESRRFFYDSLDRLAKAKDATGSTVLHEYGYDPVGNRTSKLGPLGPTEYGYEAVGSSTSNRLDVATGAEARDYVHDVYGNRIYDGPPPFPGTQSLVYDDANRLIRVQDPASPFNLCATYTYDAFGRRVYKIDWVRGKEFVYLYDTDGRLLQEVEKKSNATDLNRTYVYLEDDLVGTIDRVQEAGVAGTWAGFSLEAPDPRSPVFVLALVTAGTGLLLLLARRSLAGATAATGALLAVFTCAGTNRPPPVYSWVHTDPLGTPLAVTDAPDYAGSAVLWRAKYEPFGKATVDGDPDGNGNSFELNVRFPGQYHDWETGLHYNYSRTFDPQTGRYLEPDPLSLSGGLNLYAYVAGNPVNWVDPLGATKVKFHTSRFVLFVDPEAPPLHLYGIPATSGRDECMNQPRCSDEFLRGPIPPGLYTLDTSLLSKPGFLGGLARNALGDWGGWRAPLTPAAGTPLPKSRTGSFFLHLGRFPGSAGCIDIGGGLFGNPITDQVLRDLLSDPDGLVPIEVLP